MTNNPIDVIFRFRVKPGKLELYKQAIDFIQPLKERIVREVGYGLSLEGSSSADLVKSSAHSLGNVRDAAT